MEIEELWDVRDKYMPQYELELNRFDEDGDVSWRFSGRDTSDNHSELIIHVDRKALKDLHSAIEHELYPERYLPPVPRKTNYDELFELMSNLGIPEESIDRIIDRIQIAEHEQRTE